MSDLARASTHIEIFYSGLESFMEDPCLKAYDEAKNNFKDTLQSVDQLNALILGIGLGIISAGIGGCLGVLLEGCIVSQFTKLNSFLWAGNKAAQEKFLNVMKAGAVEMVQAITQAAATSPVALMARDVGLNLADESPLELEKERELRSRILSERGKILDLLLELDKSKAVNGNGLGDVGPLESWAIGMTGPRAMYLVGKEVKDKKYKLLVKRFELALWWKWLCKIGPYQSHDINLEGGNFIKYDRTVSDWSFLSGVLPYSGCLHYNVQLRLKELTRLTPQQINNDVIPHFSNRTGKLLPDQHIENMLNKVFPP